MPGFRLPQTTEGKRFAASMGWYSLVRIVFRSDRELAAALGVPAVRITGWKRAEAPSAEEEQLLADLGFVTSRFLAILLPEAVSSALHAESIDGRSPLEYIRRGHVEPVLGLISAMETGSFL